MVETPTRKRNLEDSPILSSTTNRSVQDPAHSSKATCLASDVDFDFDEFDSLDFENICDQLESIPQIKPPSPVPAVPGGSYYRMHVTAVRLLEIAGLSQIKVSLRPNFVYQERLLTLHIYLIGAICFRLS